MINFILATTKQHFKIIEALADAIWREHYVPIIGIEQVEYMLKNFQSAKVMFSQHNEGYQYFLIHFNNEPVGYLSFIKQDNSLFLSKIYVSKDYRGKKIGKSAMDFVQKRALEQTCKSITLGVNRYNNKSIAAYEAMGFKRVGEVITDIGNGFVMDDYKMERIVV